jgi:hypothetical protein
LTLTPANVVVAVILFVRLEDGIVLVVAADDVDVDGISLFSFEPLFCCRRCHVSQKLAKQIDQSRLRHLQRVSNLINGVSPLSDCKNVV